MKLLRSLLIFISLQSALCLSAPLTPQTQKGACTIHLTRVSPRISVIIPVYRELKNRNIFQLLKTFTNQTVPHDTYELVIVLNNVLEIARPGNPVYEENQKTLQILHYVDGTLPLLPKALAQEVSTADRKTLWVARNKKLKIQVIDLSSHTPSANIVHPGKNMGALRDIGVQNVFERFPDEDRILMLFDADTRIDTHFLGKVKEYFSDPEIDAVFASVDYKLQPYATESLFKTTFAYRYLIGQFDLENLLLNPKRGVQVSGYQILLRANSLKKRGGHIPHLPENEDAALGKLFSKSRYLLPSDLETLTLDRARIDGFDSAARLDYAAHAQPVPSDLELVSEKGPLHIDALRKNLAFNEVFHLEEQLERVSKLHEHSVDGLTKSLHSIYLNECLHDSFNHEFLDGNNWILQTVTKFKQAGKTFQELLKYLKTQFPDWFLLFNQTPNKKRADELRTLTLFLRNALTHPDQFPSTVRYLKTLSTY